ncbi:Na(+)-translocating NADH-quinone reductase subunit A [Nitratireductor sp. OM-1]|uniref:Na(+)-translocating NADH-quinone reductase subunit A n=1 Tax=Nitratireductor sp. OM-1 TaxID=1756988 RepID=UPI000DDC7ACB|nr:Na(+)-translocating NADH-quinone reductase subunit A [Nitratireductor sp. OM-1]
MFGPAFSAGLVFPHDRVPLQSENPVEVLTEEAALTPSPGEELRVEALVGEDELVAQGQPLLRLRNAPQIALVAPMAGRIASLDLKSGRRLSQLLLFHEPDGGRHLFEAGNAEVDGNALRALLQSSGLWRMFRSRPFGRMPHADEAPAAIFVMAVDSRPGAPAPSLALEGREEDFSRGLAALSQLTKDRLFLCEPAGKHFGGAVPAGLSRISCGRNHPQGLAGIQIHRHRPAAPEIRVWDIEAEDVADLGALLATGLLPGTRLVSVTGSALRERRLVRCQHGADLRGLSQPVVRPGAHEILSGSALDGRPAHWLGARDRQVTVSPRETGAVKHHWFGTALRKAARHLPVIPTAALDQAMGGDMPAAALLRAIASGDEETAVRLGALSLVEEDLALADYATGARPRLPKQLRIILNRIEAEEAPA